MFWATAARKNCSRTNFSLRMAQATQSDLILEFREQGFHLFLSCCALANSGGLTNSRVRWRGRPIHVHGEIFISPLLHCAFCEHAPPTFAAADTGTWNSSGWLVIGEECERCWGPSMQLTRAETYALQTRVIDSSGDTSDYLLARRLIGLRICHEHSDRNLPSIR